MEGGLEELEEGVGDGVARGGLSPEVGSLGEAFEGGEDVGAVLGEARAIRGALAEFAYLRRGRRRVDGRSSAAVGVSGEGVRRLLVTEGVRRRLVTEAGRGRVRLREMSTTERRPEETGAALAVQVRRSHGGEGRRLLASVAAGGRRGLVLKGGGGTVEGLVEVAREGVDEGQKGPSVFDVDDLELLEEMGDVPRAVGDPRGRRGPQGLEVDLALEPRVAPDVRERVAPVLPVRQQRRHERHAVPRQLRPRLHRQHEMSSPLEDLSARRRRVVSKKRGV
mmetsp:Transcript_14416/g.47011  ORF Transcript_14416/g.47011 Transcript_14416/m.47011 type:complete len:279 (-) Transcript_14416:544-1380(-)